MLSPEKLRRISLNQQGLLKVDAFGRGKRAVLRAIEHLGYVQIDTISVVERAHHHVLWSRVSNYGPQMLSQLVAEREVFEYWFHAASWLPMRDYRFSLPRMKLENGDRNWFANSEPKLIRYILDRIADEGPLRARDFEAPRNGKQLWWDWKPAKRALEQLFMQGELMVSRREGFQKVYDLRERVLPADIDTAEPALDEYADFLIDTTIRAHGIATLKSMTYLRKGLALRQAVRDRIQARVEAGLLIEQKISCDEVWYLEPALIETRAPRSRAKARIISPFDNAVIQRERLRNLFDFDYQIECYVPQPKRQYGYFCLPILYRSRFVGRVDCKVHRRQQRLEVISIYIERPVDAEFHHALSLELRLFAKFNACNEEIDLANSVWRQV